MPFTLVEHLGQMVHSGTDHGYSEQRATVAVMFPALGGTHPEALQLGQDGPDHRTLLFQRMHVSEQDVELECTEVHTTSSSGRRDRVTGGRSPAGHPVFVTISRAASRATRRPR